MSTTTTITAATVPVPVPRAMELVSTSGQSPAPPDPEHAQPSEPNKVTTAMILATVTGVTTISSLLGGVVIVSLPEMAKDLPLSESVILWPASIYALTCGCTLIIAGTVADVVGNRFMYLLGTLLQSAFTLACGLSRNSLQLLVSRALAGIAIAFCLPSAVSLITLYFPHGRSRNVAFAAMGSGQPIGFSIGLAVGGVLADGPGWRTSFYIASAANTVLLGIRILGLPKSPQQYHHLLRRLATEVDWPGALTLSTSLGLLSYVFAVLTANVSGVKSPANIACLAIAVALIPVFVFWVGRQEKQGRPAVIPNSLWRNRVFTTICMDVFLVWGAFQAIETLLTFFFQDVQLLSATQASLRFMPAAIFGLITNVVVGLTVHKVRANWMVIGAMVITSIAPILVAVMKIRASYWEYAFPAIALNVIGPDTLFTVSNLVITGAFPKKTQAVAGGVFNTVAQIGKSVGLALSAVISASITRQSVYPDKLSPPALMEGYRAAFWFCLATCLATLVISSWGLRSIGKIGVKRE